MKKLKKQTKDLVGNAMFVSAGSLGLGAIGGAAATHGQQGLANVARFYPAMGSVMGAGALLRTTEKVFNKKKKKGYGW